jgi:Ni,Fe-hydrogenase I large subunit
MPKEKKITNKQLINYMSAVENKYDHAINTIGQTVADLIEFLNKRDEFMEWLKEVKYKNAKNMQGMSKEMEGNNRDKESKIHRI